MAWIYSPALAESDWRSAHGSEPSHTASKTDTRRLFSCLGCGQVTLTELQSGTTCAPCAETCSAGSTSSSAASHARTSALLELERAWKVSAADFFSRLCDSWMKFVPLSYSLRMSRRSAQEDLTALSTSLPREGMTVAGLFFPLQASERRISEKDGSYLPTPTASSYGTQKADGPAGYRPSLETMARKNLWPTPVARDFKGQGMSRERRESRAPDNLCSAVMVSDGSGTLNPQWVEWLMGYPLAWTELDALATQWFRSKHGRRSPGYSASKPRKDLEVVSDS